ncbi:hydroxylase [Spiractinospora alimapuensis]|uniref:ferritin-like fold-containing protein n=1 Tax=Spiractinospora alimapuensis TaxID=2820884 RepID=UPI001F369CC3|nr:ferritin-like fold-containing protein [Spiractinospora alimapuensis]QVQ54032.1 hydroxylase [Spiractinospora alimapuensis]
MVESPDTSKNDQDVPREAVVDLLGLLAYGELVSFFRLTSDALLAPTLTDKAALAGLASVEYQHYAQLRDRLTELDVDVETAMRPFIPALDAWHEVTQPQNWLEGLVKAYVGDGIAADFYRQVADALDGDTQTLVHGVLDEGERAAFVVARVREAVDQDQKLAGRLALWGRRLVGEALSQAQRVAQDHPAFAELVTAGVEESASDDDDGVGRAPARLTEGYSRRLKELGLAT